MICSHEDWMLNKTDKYYLIIGCLNKIIQNKSLSRFKDTAASMTVQISPEEQLKFSNIMYMSEGRQRQQIQNLSPNQKSKLKSIYAQKIAYQTANVGVKPAPAPAPSSSGGIMSILCCCFMPQQNKDKFDISSSTFVKRILGAFLFFKSDFLSIGDKRQLYGFLWLSITYVIILGIAANLNEYFVLPTNYNFSNDLMLKGLGICAIFLIAEPFIYQGVVKCLKGAIDPIQSMMLTGYSTVLYFIPTILCLIPSLYWHVGMLSIAGLLRSIFLFRNYSQKIPQKSFVILIVILIIQFLFLFSILRLLFPNNSGYNFTDGTSRVFKGSSHFSSRIFND